MPEVFFDHEKLQAYQESISFVAWLADLIENGPRLGEVKDQLDRASSSISLNTAEGNGKYSPDDRCRFFDIAHASALECAAAFDVLVARRKVDSSQIRSGKMMLQRIVRMLIGLKRANPKRSYVRKEAAPT